MENFHYRYMIHAKQQQHFDGNWEEEEETPTTSQQEAESESVSCDVCRRNFRSKKALWGHRRCCKAARTVDNQNEGGTVSGTKHDVLESGWCVTAKRGRKPVIEITSPEFVAAGILFYMSSGKNGDVVSTHDSERKKTEKDESQPFGESQMAQIICGDKFMCVICGKAFPSNQALGGHEASHGKDDAMINSGKDEKEVTHSKGLTSGDHRCDICGVSYPSGQALGGHKRKHWTDSGSSFLPAGNKNKASEVEASTFPASVVPCMHALGLFLDK